MQFLNPLMLWSALAVAVPVAIHLWHRQRGRVLPWAATAWLVARQQEQHRGLRLDNVLLLALRCLMLLMLAGLLAEPVLRQTEKPVRPRVHLVQPDRVVTDAFKFELADAQRRGEAVRGLTTNGLSRDLKMTSVDENATFPTTARFTALGLQAALDSLAGHEVETHLYLSQTAPLNDLPGYVVSARPRLHLAPDSARRPTPFWALTGGRQAYVAATGRLAVTSGNVATGLPGQRLAERPAHTGPFRALVAYRNPAERQTVEAALAALNEVYSLNIQPERQAAPGVQYDWVLTDQLPLNPNPATYYVVSGGPAPVAAPNVLYSPAPLMPATSDKVATGQLPEWLAEGVLRHYKLDNRPQPLSQAQVAGLFVESGPAFRPRRVAGAQDTSLRQWLALLLIMLVLAERSLALIKGA